MSKLPDETWAGMPADALSEMDHYQYGSPKRKRVTNVFADTFYWATLAMPKEASHTPALAFTGNIVTTEEVLVEYLTFFANAPEYVHRDIFLSITTSWLIPTFALYCKAMPAS